MFNLFKQAFISIIMVLLLVISPVLAEARPQVDDHFPEHRAKNVPINVIIKIEFSDRMDKDSVVDGITLRDQDGRTVPGRVTYEESSYKASFKPDQPLKYNTQYRVRLASSIRDRDGERIQSDSFTFTTVRNAVMYVDGLEVTDKSISVNNSPVDIILDAPGAAKVLYGKEELYDSGDRYYLENVVLKPGNNNLSFKIIYQSKDEKDNTKEETLSFSKGVFFVDTLDEGAQITHNLQSSNKVSVFDKKLNILFPKNYYLREGGRAAGSQVIALKSERVYRVDGSPVVGYLINISPVPGVEGNYNYGHFGDTPINIDVPPGGQMTLPVDEDLAEAAFRTLTVLYDPQDGVLNNWRNLGGKVDVKKKTVTVPFQGFGRYVVVNRIWSFMDQLDWPALHRVELLWARGILAPSAAAGPGYFGLTDQQGRALPVNRGEFVVMLGKGLGLNLPDSHVSLGIFSDISFLSNYSFSYNKAGVLVPLPQDHAKYIEAAAKNGIVSGFREKDGRYLFRYHDPVTREQAAVIIAAAAGLQLTGTNEANLAKLATLFKDYQSISPGARPHVLVATTSGYLQGDQNGNFRPDAGLTKVEAAEMVYKLMENRKLL